MTIVPFSKHGRPWSDYGQLMVISWSTMVNDHDPAARVILDAILPYNGCFAGYFGYIVK